MKKHLPIIAVVALVVALAAPVAVALSPAMSMLNSIDPVSCGTTPTKIALDPSTPARSICVQNDQAVDVFVGGPTVSTANGHRLPSASTSAPSNFCFDAQTGWCIVASSTSPVRVTAGNGYSGK
jgi:hypothetical protein